MSMIVARAGYQNSTCKEERFKYHLRGECGCIAPLTMYSLDLALISGQIPNFAKM